MDNPYQQKQAQLLQRIVSNAQKCNEAMGLVNEVLQNILTANADAESAAEIFRFYRSVVRASLQSEAEAAAAATVANTDKQSP